MSQERETPLRPVNVYYPGLYPGERMIYHGYAYQNMHPRKQPAQFFNSDYPYSTLVSSTPDWVGLNLLDVINYVKQPFRIIRPRQLYPNSDYVGNRLNIFVDDKNVITSLAYH
jgi:hypothetical protein